MISVAKEGPYDFLSKFLSFLSTKIWFMQVYEHVFP